MKVDQTVRRETGYIAACSLAMSAVMQLVFLLLGKWDFTVLLGNLLSLAAGIGNFFLMGITVQSAVKKEKKEMENAVRISQMLRMLVLFLVAAVGATVPVFNVWAVLIPLFFARLSIFLRPFYDKQFKKESKGGDADA